MSTLTEIRGALEPLKHKVRRFILLRSMRGQMLDEDVQEMNALEEELRGPKPWQQAEDALAQAPAVSAPKHPCTCPFSEKDPDAMCGPGCKCLACHPERSATACSIKETSRRHRGPLVTPKEARRATRDMGDPEYRDQNAYDLLHRYIDQQETADRHLEIWADTANSLLGAMANGDEGATRLAYDRVLKLVDGHWPEYSPPQPQVATFMPGSEQGANPPAAAPGSEGRDRAAPPDATVVSAAVDARQIRALLATVVRQANDGEHSDSEVYQRHFTCLAIENLARAVTLLADRLPPVPSAADLDR